MCGFKENVTEIYLICSVLDYGIVVYGLAASSKTRHDSISGFETLHRSIQNNSSCSSAGRDGRDCLPTLKNASFFNLFS